MAKDSADSIEITHNQFGYTVKLTKEGGYAYVIFNDFEFIKGGAILFSKFVALKTENRLEFAALETNLSVEAAYNLWQKTVLNCNDAGIKLPFIEFICDGINLTRLPNVNNAGYSLDPDTESLFRIDLVNCWTRTEFFNSVFNPDHPEKKIPRKGLKFYPTRLFAEIYYTKNGTSFFHGRFYNAVGKMFIHNRLRIKISQYILTEFGDYYMEFKDAKISDRKTSNSKAV